MYTHQIANTSPAYTGIEATEGEFCYRHPDRETGLRCIQCSRAVCTRCVILASVGQLCRDCAGARRPANYRVSPGALALASSAAGFLTLMLASMTLLLIAPLPIYAVSLLLAGGVATANIILRVLDRLTRAKRGTAMQIAVGIGMVLGAIPVLVAALVCTSPIDMVLVLIFVVTLTLRTLMQLR